jgi:hypothetical protein
MLEITGSDIAALNDDDLRSLVGMLCESELHARNLSTAAVTWGGDQSATDGGIDVCVKIEDGEGPSGYVPRKNVRFQCKKTDFTPGKIAPEMRPEGQLRTSIAGLISDQGAYIIVSSDANTSFTALNSRLKAMRSAVSDKPDHENLHLDFYDRNRLATWTRSHLGLVLWVRQKIGRSVPGWQSYGSWASSPDGIQDEFLIDDDVRLHCGIADEKGLHVEHGINRIRDILREARGVVRLVGLSGVGKTRLVQAIFDKRVGNNPLDPALVFYTDMNDDPSPQPTGMISDLIASRACAVVVVDNCASDLHRRIAELCRTPECSISVITVEYDVRDDEPEGTKVYRLEPSSDELVSKLVRRRFPEMMLPNVDTISKFSNGNARIALALASGIDQHESIAGLRDEELLKRLIQQRHEFDENLIKAAQACSLLYSFQGEAIGNDEAELPKISALAGLSTQELYSKVSQLKHRNLVQRRSVWRAVLPHAVANRLAAKALREIPIELIMEQFNTTRLLKSFTRRLGYLHESDEAQSIANRWLAKDGYLAHVGNFSEIGIAMFEDIAPVSPESTLVAIEREMPGAYASEETSDRYRDRIGTILRSIAYAPSLFSRCVAAMIPIALSEPTDRSHSARTDLEGLFHLFLSGTHATIEQRTAIVDGLLRSNESVKQSLGVQLLEALFKADGFSPTHTFEFGARSRDYGYSPKAPNDRAHWFATTLQLARPFASQKDETSRRLRSTIANCVLNAWFLGPLVQEQFEAIADQLAANGYWHEGWLAARSLLSDNLNNEGVAAIERLRTFERRLRPKNVAERVKAVVLSPRHGAFDYAELYYDDDRTEISDPMVAHKKANEAAYKLGEEVGGEPALFEILLPDLVRGNAGRLFAFGQGLVFASNDRRSSWKQLLQAVADTEQSQRNVEVLIGFLNGLFSIDEALCEVLLDESVVHETLGEYFPALQSAVAISESGVGRLKRSLDIGKSQAGAFRFLAYRQELGANDFSTIVRLLAKQKDGFGIAICMLASRFDSDQLQTKIYPSQLLDVGRELLSSPDFSNRDNTYDYNLQVIANVCLPGTEGAVVSTSLCKRIKQGLKDGTFQAYNHARLVRCVFQLQPRIALDVFFGDADGTDFDIDDFDDPAGNRRNPIDEVSCEEMLRWCDEKPVDRYLAISRAVSYCFASKDGAIEWTPLAIMMFQQSPEPVCVLEIFVRRFYPRMWSGSRAAIVESRLALIDQLKDIRNAKLDSCVTRIREQLAIDIVRMRNSEDEHDSLQNERFE